ncbi:MAG: cytochrome c [Actinomycetota bacterium]|nr:cytochrome c [Actinomycetota bacterium]
MSGPKRKTNPAPPPRRFQGGRLIWIAAGVLGLGLLIAIAISATPPEPPSSIADPGAIAEGRQLFLTNCAACHGIDLRGTEQGPPLLNVIYAPNHHGDESFQQAVAFGVPPHHWNFGTMAPLEHLSRDEVAKIVAFVRAEQQAAGITRDPSHP